MGDPTESTSGNYPTQIYTLELNRRQQLGMALDLWLAGLRAFAPLAPDVEFGSLLCNHGENRQRGAQVTEEADNDSACLAETLRTVLAEREGFGHVRWSIPADQMCMTTRMSGVEVALTHGHRMPTTAAKEVDWLRGQSIRLLREHGAEPRLWLTAHLHHLAVTDYGPFTRIQCPTSDSGSGWFSDRTGLWSTPGVLTCLVGEHPEARGMGWSDLAIL